MVELQQAGGKLAHTALHMHACAWKLGAQQPCQFLGALEACHKASATACHSIPGKEDHRLHAREGTKELAPACLVYQLETAVATRNCCPRRKKKLQLNRAA